MKYIASVVALILSTVLLSGCYWYIDDGFGPRHNHGYYDGYHNGYRR